METYRGRHLRQGLAFLQPWCHRVHPGQWSCSTQCTQTEQLGQRRAWDHKRTEKEPKRLCTYSEHPSVWWNLQEMSGTACSDMWVLCSSSDLPSDKLSPCSLETTHNTNTSVHRGYLFHLNNLLNRDFQQQHWNACLEIESQITIRQTSLYQPEVMRQRGSV